MSAAAQGHGARPRKAAGAFRTISEAAEELNVPQHVLRFWETKFPSLQPLKRGGGRRYYRPEDLALLKGVNEAWSREDLAALSRLATPEMVGYFRDDYAALAARGWRNETRDVRLEQGDLSEAWSEGARDYATVAMRFSLVDVTREAATGRVTEGDPERRQMATEVWTFVRVPGGPWQLSAIQQTG